MGATGGRGGTGVASTPPAFVPLGTIRVSR